MNGQRNFEKHIRGVCVVENGDILRGPPRKVKVSLHHLDAPAPRWCCCCWPRTPSCDKVAKFEFKKQKSEASLQKYTSLETAMYMNGMVFQEYWKPGKVAVKVSVTQRRGKKLIFFARLTTFLDEMRDREAEQFVLYVTESGFRIITKVKTASGDEETRTPQKKTKHASRKKGEYDKREYYEKKEKIDYMTSLLTSFKEKKEEPAQILTSPEVVKLPPVIPMLSVQTNNLTASHCSPLHKEAPAAREQHITASRAVLRELQPSKNRNEQQNPASRPVLREVQPSKNRNEQHCTASRSVLREVQPSSNRTQLNDKVQMVKIQGKDDRDVECNRKNITEKDKTAAWEEYAGHEAEKEETDTDNVKNAVPKKENTDKEEKEANGEIVTKCPPEEENTNKKHIEGTEGQDVTGKEQHPGITSEEQLIQEQDNENTESQEKNTAEEEETTAWQEFIEDEAEKEQGIMSEVQLVQEKDDEHSEGEEEILYEGKETEVCEDSDEHDTGKEETDADEVNSDAPEKDWQDYAEHDTGKEETDADEVNSDAPEKDWEDYVEHDTGKEETDADEMNSDAPEKDWEDYDACDTGKEETDADEMNSDAPEKDWQDYVEHDTGKEETDADEVNSDAPEKDWEDYDACDTGKEETDADEVNSDAPEKDWEDYDACDTGKEETDADEMNSDAPEKDWEDYDARDTGKEETDADEVNSDAPGKENTEDWEDYDEQEIGKGETDAEEVNSDPAEKDETEDWQDYDEQEMDAEEVNSIPPENDDGDNADKEDAEKECVSVKDKEPGIMTDTHLVQEGDDEDTQSEEKSPNEEETATEEGDHETKKETDAEEVNSAPAEKENTGEEERRNFEKGVEKEDLTEKVNFPSIAKLMSSTNVTVKNKPRRDKIKKAMHLRKKKDSPDHKKSVRSRWRWWKTSPTTPVEKMTPSKNIGKSHNLKKKVLTCRHKKTVMGNAPPAPVRKMTPRVTAKKELDLRKKTLPCSHKRNVLSLKRNRKASGEKKKRYRKLNLKSVRSKIDSQSSVPADYKPELDLSVLESQPPPPGPARVRWAREMAALRTRLHTRKQTSARSLVHGSRAAHR